MRLRAFLRLAAGTALLLLSPFAFSQTPVSYQQSTYPAADFVHTAVRVDLNGDGADDLITAVETHDGMWVYMNNGDGSFKVPVHYAGSGSNAGYAQLLTGDWNNDGKPDVILDAQDGATVFLNNGDGTLRTKSSHLTTLSSGRAAVADFNSDGKLDLVLWGWKIAYGDGTGNFGVPESVGYDAPTESSPIDVVTADFDADGHADIFVVQSTYSSDFVPTTYMTTLYGHGDKTFTKVSEVNQFNVMTDGAAIGDVDQDGKADVVLAEYGCPSCQPGMRVLYGSSSRTFSRRTFVNTNEDTPHTIEVADMNGDGRQDAVMSLWGPTHKLITFLQNADGSFTQQDEVFGTQAASQDFEGPVVLGDFNKDRKPDVIQDRYTWNSGGGATTNLIEFLNQTNSTGFPSCSPAAPQGIHVCAPAAGTTVASPVHFAIGAASSTPLRKVEVWIDSHKQKETFYSWANKSFMESDLTLAEGFHNATVYAVGYDNRLLKTSFGFTVSAGGGGGGSCSNSTTTSTTICSPQSGSTVSSPVNIQAAGGSSVKNMEAWVDGVRKYAGSGNTVLLSLALANGSHKLTIFSKSGSTTLSGGVSNFTVSSGGGGDCASSSSTATVICAPAEGSTVSNPVSASAKGGSSVKNMELWVDGVRKAVSSSNSISASLTLSAGTHKLTAFGKNGSTVLSSAVSHFTVK